MRNITFLVMLINFLINTTALSKQSTLKLVHVVFRHGDKTPDYTYPNDPHREFHYPPYGLGNLRNSGKQRAFLLGKTMQTRYKDFLGGTYDPEVLDATSTHLNRARASLEFFLAGLYSNKSMYLEWENDDSSRQKRIPYKYLVYDDDSLMSPPRYYCPNYIKHIHAYQNSPEGLRLLEKYKDLFKYLSETTGWNVTTITNVTHINDLLTVQEEWGLSLPQWSDAVYKQKPMKDSMIDRNIMGTATPRLTQLSSFLLKKIIEDTQAKIEGKPIYKNRKIFLYSGHDYNVAFLLNSMNLLIRDLPPYAAYVIIELHEIDDVYGIKAFYQDYSQYAPRLLQIPDSEAFCPFNTFVKLLKNNLPTTDDMCTNENV